MEFGLDDGCDDITLTTATNTLSYFSGLAQKKLITQSLKSPMWILSFFSVWCFRDPGSFQLVAYEFLPRGPKNLLPPVGRHEERKNAIREFSRFLAGDMHVLFKPLQIIPVYSSPWSKERGRCLMTPRKCSHFVARWLLLLLIGSMMGCLRVHLYHHCLGLSLS